VGKTVYGKSPGYAWAKPYMGSLQRFRVFSKDSLLNLEHFDTHLKGAADCGKSSE